MTRDELAIIKTLIYADIFSFPLTEVEIWRYLIGKKTKLENFRRALKQLSHRRIIYQVKEYYSLKNESKFVKSRLNNKKYISEKLQQAKRICKLLFYFPTVWFIGISGTLAVENTTRDDDIDIFIISAPKTLWLTRFITTILLDLLGLRRKPETDNLANKICLNMLMDADDLRLPKNERDLYSAHEIAQLKPLYNRNRTYENFLFANRWIKDFLPHALLPGISIIKPDPFPWKKILGYWEWLFRSLQLWYMHSKRTHEVIKKNMLRFHPHDVRQKILLEFNIRLQNHLKY